VNLPGTGSEQQPGVGGTGDHPAPASIVGEDGQLHQAGEPVGVASSNAPEGDSTDLQSGDLSPEAEAERDRADPEPDQVEIDRPDLGTPSPEAEAESEPEPEDETEPE
jgi:hypothetical protein